VCRLFIYGHGNVVRTIDTDFGLSAYQWRGVWGERQTGTLQTGQGYCANLGHQEDETGFIYMRARYYEPATGRFISEDPARDGVNWYLYADGNAVNRVDFTGEAADWLLIAGGLSLILSFIANEIGASHPLTKTLKSLLSETARAISAATFAIRLGSRDSKVAAVASALVAGVGVVVAIAAIHQFVLAIIIIGMDMGWHDYPTAIINREAGWRYLDRAGRIWDFFSN
jgi:RHS repeat-associated protein